MGDIATCGQMDSPSSLLSYASGFTPPLAILWSLKCTPPSVLMFCFLFCFSPTFQTVQLRIHFSCLYLTIGIYSSLFVTPHAFCTPALSGPSPQGGIPPNHSLIQSTDINGVLFTCQSILGATDNTINNIDDSLLSKNLYLPFWILSHEL